MRLHRARVVDVCYNACMKTLLLFVLAVGVASFALGQEEYVPGHFDKKGKYIEGHYKKKADHSGKHKELRYYDGHYDKNGKWIKPHSAWVWVKD
jgi:hypothetical protein